MGFYNLSAANRLPIFDASEVDACKRLSDLQTNGSDNIEQLRQRFVELQLV